MPTPATDQPRLSSPIVTGLVLAALYLISGRLGLMLAIPPGYATAIFPSSGIALAGLLVYGTRLWPAVWLGSFGLNVWIGLGAPGGLTIESLTVAAGIASGAAFQALAGSWLVRRVVGFPNALDQPRDIIGFLALGGPASCVVNATIGPSMLLATGAIGSEQYLQSWWTWWIGDTIGVLIVAPLTLIATAAPRSLWRRRLLPVALPLAITFAVVIVVFIRTSTLELQRIELDFRERAGRVADELHVSLASYVEIVRSIGRLYDASGDIDRAAFETFVERALTTHRGIHALEWIPRVPDAGRDAFEAAIRAEGYMNFEITERAPDGRLVRAQTRAEYFPPVFIEPLAGNLRAFGFDVGSNPERRAALERARDHAVVVATAPLTLVQETGESLGFLVFRPVFERPLLRTPAQERRASLRGYATGVFRVHEIVDAVLREPARGDVYLELLDVTPGAPATVLYTGTQPAAPGIADKAVVDFEFELAERKYRLHMLPTTAFVAAQRNWYAWLVLASGLVFTGLLGAFLLAVTGHTSRIESLVARRTQELEEANRSVAAKNRLLAAISAAQAEFIAEREPHRLFDRLLAHLLAITDSEYGFIGEVLHTPQGTPYLKTHAITNIAWNDETRRLYEERGPQGMEFTNLDTLFGEVVRSGEVVISNAPAADLRAGGLPAGHPPLNAFLGLPFHKGARMIGMVGIANRPGGYDQELAAALSPFLSTCANIIEALRSEQERQRSQQALRDSESRLRAILDNAVEAIITVDENAVVESANIAAENLFGYDAAQIVGRNARMLLDGDAGAEFLQLHDRYVQGKGDGFTGVPREVAGRRSDGERVPIEIAVSEVRLGDRRLFTWLLRDLTERKKVDRMKNEFISTVSHELRTPLTSIRGSLGLVAGGVGGEIPEAARKLLATASENSERLTRLINDILDIEKLEFGNLEIPLVRQPLLPLVRSAIDFNAGYATRFSVRIVLAPAPAQDIHVAVDSDRFIQVLTNLLSNAVKFSPEGGQVEVDVAVRDAAVRVSVTDHGPGIPAEFRARIFEKFSQADASASRRRAGTGLGLNLTKAMVERMHGSIDFTSEPNVATTFFVDLPLAAPPPPQSRTEN